MNTPPSPPPETEPGGNLMIVVILVIVLTGLGGIIWSSVPTKGRPTVDTRHFPAPAEADAKPAGDPAAVPPPTPTPR